MMPGFHQVSEAMDIDANGAEVKSTSSAPGASMLPEVEMFCILISQMYLVTCKEFEQVRSI